MNKSLLIGILMIVIVSLARPQDVPQQAPAPQLITITSRGQDVRTVLHDIFAQAKKNFVVVDTPRTELFLALNGVEFDEALALICSTAKLNLEVQNGIYFISRAAAPPLVKVLPAGKLSDAALQRKVSSKMGKSSLKQVFEHISKQAQVKIELDGGVPAYMVEAVISDMSLKAALETLTKAAGLEYRLTENLSILVYKPTGNKVVVVQPGLG